jgi:phospholipid/cholesterol/gamma-HCH transport system substrate-binding protein
MRKSFISKITIRSVFDDVNGLKKGNNVWFSGVKVGIVKSIRFYGKSKVEVDLSIEEKSQEYIRKDAHVKISSDGLIGNRIVVITGGSPQVPAVEEGDMLTALKEDGQQEILNTLQANNKNILAITTDLKDITQSIKKGEGSVGKLLTDDKLFTDLERTMATLRTASVNAQQLTASLSSYGNKLNQKGGLANDLATDTLIMSNVRLTVTKLNETASTARSLIAQLQQSAQGITTELTPDRKSPVGVLLHDETAASQIKATLQNLTAGSKKLDENLEALQHNFLFRRYFRKQKKEQENQDTTAVLSQK